MRFQIPDSGSRSWTRLCCKETIDKDEEIDPIPSRSTRLQSLRKRAVKFEYFAPNCRISGMKLLARTSRETDGIKSPKSFRLVFLVRAEIIRTLSVFKSESMQFLTLSRHSPPIKTPMRIRAFSLNRVVKFNQEPSSDEEIGLAAVGASRPGDVDQGRSFRRL